MGAGQARARLQRAVVVGEWLQPKQEGGDQRGRRVVRAVVKGGHAARRVVPLGVPACHAPRPCREAFAWDGERGGWGGGACAWFELARRQTAKLLGALGRLRAHRLVPGG